MKRRHFAKLTVMAPWVAAAAQSTQPAVSVRVEGMLGEERVPIGLVQVVLLQRRPSMNIPFPLPRRSEVTGRDGWAHFYSLEPAVYTANIRPVLPKDDAEGWLPDYSGGAPSWKTAETFSVRPGGAPLEFTFLLKRGKPERLTGKALTEEGRPADGALMTLSREDLPIPPIAKATARGDGSFDFGFVFPDSYRIRGEWQSQSADELYSLPVGGAPPAAIRLEATFPLEGTVGGKEFLDALPKFSGLRIHALPASGAIFNEGATPVQPDGSFKFAAMAPGRYQLQPSVEPTGFYVSRVRLAGMDVLGETVDLHRGLGPLEVEFESGPGRLTGHVDDASKGEKEPAPEGVCVALVNTDAKRRHFMLFIRSGQTNAKGDFSIEGIPPGEYYAWAFDRLETRDLDDAMLIERLKPAAETVKIVRNQSSSVNLKLSVWEIVAGT